MTFQIIRSWRACKDESDTQRILYKSIIRSCSITRILQFFEYWESCFLSPSGDLKNKPRIGTIRDVSFFFFTQNPTSATCLHGCGMKNYILLLLLLFLYDQFCILNKEKHAQYTILVLFLEINGPEKNRSNNFCPFS